MEGTRRLYPQELALVAHARQQGAHRPASTPRQLPSVTVVVLTRDRLHLTRRCIESIYRHSDYPFELLLYDDGSQPETLSYLHAVAAANASVRLMVGQTAIGVAAARNVAFAAATTDFVYSLDNDIICHPGWLSATMACAVAQAADFVAPLRLEPDGLVWAFAAELVRTEGDTVLELARWFYGLPATTVQRLFPQGARPPTSSLAAQGCCAGRRFSPAVAFPRLMAMALRIMTSAATGCAWVQGLGCRGRSADPRRRVASPVRYRRAVRRARYDLATIRAAAAIFRRKWGLEVLPGATRNELRAAPGAQAHAGSPGPGKGWYKTGRNAN